MCAASGFQAGERRRTPGGGVSHVLFEFLSGKEVFVLGDSLTSWFWS